MKRKEKSHLLHHTATAAPPPHCGVLQPGNEPVDVISDADESMSGNSPSSPTSETVEDGVSLNGYATDQSFGDMGMDDTDMEVVLYTDYVLYRDIYCTGPQLTFSHSCIKISGSNPHGNEGTFNFECGVDDVIDITCQWTRRVETVIIKLRVVTKDAVQTNNECSTPGIEELKIAVVEPNWSHKQEMITSMNVKYMAVWDIVEYRETVESLYPFSMSKVVEILNPMFGGSLSESATRKGSSLKGKQLTHFDISTRKKRKAIDAIMEIELLKKTRSDKDIDS
ncbi:hypothetical protein SO802_022445 [Lithocarpus litseifolius]|uniref:Probable ubiquitin-like-specific protease 2A/B PH domain-containing protein n=1 Tax=Lithocarpus litseifolius TaxID=425828 RepID=A0AAW2CM29_9ROSI